MREVAHLIKRHLSNVLTYITYPVTNATSEGLNSKIQTIKRRSSSEVPARFTATSENGKKRVCF